MPAAPPPPPLHRSSRSIRRPANPVVVLGVILGVVLAALAFVVLTGNDSKHTAGSDNGVTPIEGHPSDQGATSDSSEKTKSTERTGEPNPSDPQTYGDDPALDKLWDRCKAGDYGACDDLYLKSGFETDYEKFGETCGDRAESKGYCTEQYGGSADAGTTGGATGTTAVGPDDSAASDYGDDPTLDALWDRCEAGNYGACDDLYRNSGFGTAYEDFGHTCGHRNDPQGYCEELYR